MRGRALPAIAGQFLINGAVYASFVSRLPEIRDAVGADLATLGLTLTLASFGGLLGSALVGRAVEKFGTKKVLIVSTLCVLVCLGAIGFVASVAALTIVLATLQFFDVFTDVSMNLQGSWLSARRKVPVMNRLHGLWSVGMLSGGIAATWAAAAGLSLAVHLVATSIVLLLAFVFVGRNVLATDVVTQPSADAPDRSSTYNRRGLSGTMGLVMLGFAALVLEIVPTEWATFRMAEDFSFELGAAGVGFVAFTVGMVIGRLGGDFVMARVGTRRLTQAGVVQAAVGLATAALVPVAGVALLAFGVAGIGVAVVFPTLYDTAAQTVGRPGAGLGALTAGIRFGALASPIAVGYLANLDQLSVGAAMALVALPSALVVLVITHRISPRVAPAAG